MSLQEVLNEIYRMPLTEQKAIVETLSLKIKEESKNTNLSVYQHLFNKGLITHIPNGMSDTDDDFVPLEIEGEPLSETIIRERR